MVERSSAEGVADSWSQAAFLHRWEFKLTNRPGYGARKGGGGKGKKKGGGAPNPTPGEYTTAYSSPEQVQERGGEAAEGGGQGARRAKRRREEGGTGRVEKEEHMRIVGAPKCPHWRGNLDIIHDPRR